MLGRCGVTNRLLVLAGTIGMLMGATSLFAHHAWAVDTSRLITLTGTVTGYDWSNPHVQIFLDAKEGDAADAKVEKWTAGGPSPSRMAGTGWDRNTLKPGDTIRAVGHRATDKPNLLRIDKVMLANGHELNGYGR
jgi:hypothetical protein